MRRAAECGARLHLAHPLGIAGYENRRVKNDLRDATLLADLLRLGRLPGAWVAPREVRELREMVRYRAKLGRLRSGLKAQVHQIGVSPKVYLVDLAIARQREPRRRCLVNRPSPILTPEPKAFGDLTGRDYPRRIGTPGRDLER